MFTGLVQAVGWIERRGSGLVVSGCSPFAPLQLGDSVAVDGVCLTVAALVGDGFLANVSEETLQRSTLGRKASSGGSVNLEPALRLSDRLGGHLVSGHVDSIGEVVGIEALSQSWNLELRFWQSVIRPSRNDLRPIASNFTTWWLTRMPASTISVLTRISIPCRVADHTASIVVRFTIYSQRNV